MSNREPPEPEFTNLISPSPVLLELLNDGATRGYTTFHKKDSDGKLEGIASVPVDCLPGLWDQLVDDLSADGYCSANLMFKRGHGYARPGLVDQDGNPLHKPHRNSQSLCRLNAVWVDLDSYKLGLTEGEILGQIWDAQVDGTIPPPSALQSSGRGMWAFWCLHDNRAWDREVSLWREIMVHLVKLFRCSGADIQSTDPARICRVPGSLNRAAGRRVNAAILAGPEGVPRYELTELANWFGISTRRRDQVSDGKPKKLSNVGKGHKGQRLRWVHDESRFWLLVEQIRDRKIARGTRNAHCFVLGCILARRYRELDERAAQVDRQARRLWAAFEDRREYSLAQVTHEIRKAAWTARQRIAHDTIAQRLGITADEALALAQLTGRDPLKSWPTADGPIDLPPPLKARDRAAHRRAWIVANERFARQATVRQLAEALAAAGMPCSAPTAAKDRALALPPPKESTPTSLF